MASDLAEIWMAKGEVRGPASSSVYTSQSALNDNCTLKEVPTGNVQLSEYSDKGGYQEALNSDSTVRIQPRILSQ